MTFSEYIENVMGKYPFYWMDPDSMQSLDFPFEITAKEFVLFANRDLQTEGKHGLANALSNAKRAIDCQVDAVTTTLGIKKERSFPKKAENLVKLGLMAPRVISRINQQRNYLEHEYKIPAKDRVEDAVDTATLFVELTQRIFRSFQTGYKFGGSKVDQPLLDYGDNYVMVNFSRKEKKFFVNCYQDEECLVQEEIDASRPEFIPLLKVTLSSDWNYSDLSHQEIIEEFIAACRS